MKKRKKLKLDNRGAALVMAVVVIAFVSILTTTLLYLANMNYQMKSTDYKTKDVFYEAEIPLEGIRTLLVMDVAEAAAQAYDACVLNYANVPKEVRASQYQNSFYNSIMLKWEDRCKNGAVAWNWVHGMEAKGLSCVPVPTSDMCVCQSTGNDCGDSNCTKPYHIVLDATLGTARLEEVEYDDDEGNPCKKLVLKGIKVVYTKNEFSSIIETDFAISPPDINLMVDNFVDTVPTEAVKRDDIKFEQCVTYEKYKKQ